MICIKVGCSTYEVNVRTRPSEVKKLKKVPGSPWEKGALRLGRSAGADVFWSCDAKKVSILIGYDDQTWDIGVTIPLGVFKTMLREIDLLL